MSVEGSIGHRVTTPPLPTSIWVVAWASLAGQLLVVVDQGIRELSGVALVVSAAFGGVVFGFVSAGVVRARTGRLVIAWVILVLALLAQVGALTSVDDLGEGAIRGLSLAFLVVALAGLARFHKTDWYVWKRRYPSARGASITPLVTVGVVVGILGAMAALSDEGAIIQISFSGG